MLAPGPPPSEPGMVAPSGEARTRGRSSNSGEHCPCTNTTGVLASFSNRHCRLPSGDDGIQLTVGGSCVPFLYGSSRCLRHDLLHDPVCQIKDIGDSVVPNYCFRSWCYVDAAVCKLESHERVYRSSYFPYESGVDLFYSYSTCNSTAEDWLEVKDEIVGKKTLGGISILATTPAYYLYPMLFKRSQSGDILSTPGSEYYDDSIPYEGVYPNYARRIVELSKGDIQNITVTHNSKVSSLVHPTSSFTAAVQDIQDGLVDMALGPFWITGERLKMASFTIPIVQDKTFLVIPRPGTTNTFTDQAKKVLAPFSYELWGLVIVIITATAMLSVWFSDRSKKDSMIRERRTYMQAGRGLRRRKSSYARLALDSCIQKGLFFCSAGVDYDEGGSLPTQLLMCGFGFFVLIIVSTYVANLAAFLTLKSSVAPIQSIEDAVKAGVAICAHPVLKRELQVTWPEAHFYFHEAGGEFYGVLEDYDKGKCKVMAVGWEDTGNDKNYLEKLCERGLAYTKSVLIEMPLAFPVRRELEAGLSYWILQGEKYYRTSVEITKEDFPDQTSCSVHFSEQDTEVGKLDKILVENMSLPIMFFLVCMVIAVLMQIIHKKRIKRGKRSLAGTRSSLNLVHSFARYESSDNESVSEAEEEGDKSEEGESDHQNRIEEGTKYFMGTSVDMPPNSILRRQHTEASLIRHRSPDVENESKAKEEGSVEDVERKELHPVTISMRSIVAGDL